MAAHKGTPPAGALTTVFTPAASCAAHTNGLYWISTCMMENWDRYSTASYYSPGICPSGQVSAGGVPTDFGPPLEGTETGIMCCQTGLTLTRLDSATLQFQFPVTEPFQYFCHTDNPALEPHVRFNYAVQVRWAESDLSSLETNPLRPGQPPPTAPTGGRTTSGQPPPTGSTSGSTGRGLSPPTTSTSGRAAATTTRSGRGSDVTSTDLSSGGDASSGNLPIGAIVGIVIGVVIAVLAAGTGIFFFFRRRRRRFDPTPGKLTGASPGPPSPPEDCAELDGVGPARIELPADPEMVELPGD